MCLWPVSCSLLAGEGLPPERSVSCLIVSCTLNLSVLILTSNVTYYPRVSKIYRDKTLQWYTSQTRCPPGQLVVSPTTLRMSVTLLPSQISITTLYNDLVSPFPTTIRFHPPPPIFVSSSSVPARVLPILHQMFICEELD